MLQIDDSMQDPIDPQFNKDLRYLRSGARSNKCNYTNGKPYEANETTKPMKTMKPWNLWNHENNISISFLEVAILLVSDRDRVLG